MDFHSYGISQNYSQCIGLRETLQETIDFPMELWGLKAVNGPFNQSIDFSPEHRSMVRRYREDLAHLELFDAEALNSLGREILRRRRPHAIWREMAMDAAFDLGWDSRYMEVS